VAVISVAADRLPDSVYAGRLARAAAEAAARGVDALLISPSADYAYLLGYRAPALERLTCLLIPAEGSPSLILPRLEEPLARHELGALADGVASPPDRAPSGVEPTPLQRAPRRYDRNSA